MKFGVFDHVDLGATALGEHLEARLKMVEVYDRCGLYGYHVAEHHGTPLGLSPSPSVLMAAVAQRTRRIKFGPLVYILPLYHPLRLIEEVAMLDHLSGGRFQLGVGRGVSPIEMGFYGVPAAEQQARYDESLEILLKGLSSETLTYEGRFHSFKDVPMTLRPLQQPHPPLWYGVRSPETIRWAARNGVNVVTLALDAEVKAMTDLYRAEWAAAGGAPEAIPLMGVSRHLVVAESDAEAKRIAARAYARWRASFVKLWNDYGVPLRIEGVYPTSWEELEAIGNGFAGTPEAVRRFALSEAERGGFNYLVSWFAFGDLTVEEVTRSVELFSCEVAPAFEA